MKKWLEDASLTSGSCSYHKNADYNEDDDDDDDQANNDDADDTDLAIPWRKNFDKSMQ